MWFLKELIIWLSNVIITAIAVFGIFWGIDQLLHFWYYLPPRG